MCDSVCSSLSEREMSLIVPVAFKSGIVVIFVFSTVRFMSAASVWGSEPEWQSGPDEL